MNDSRSLTRTTYTHVGAITCSLFKPFWPANIQVGPHLPLASAHSFIQSSFLVFTSFRHHVRNVMWQMMMCTLYILRELYLENYSELLLYKYR
jgi:hypothetical protein